MKLLLTSAGISNKSIHNALVDLLGKPVPNPLLFSSPPAIYALPAEATKQEGSSVEL